MNLVKSFSPIAHESSKTLILGSMPGLISLQAGQYYAHPRNSFWPIIAGIYGFSAESPYEVKIQNVISHGIAIWDVLQSCERHGSLDSDIVNGTRVPNDFGLFFKQHPHIKRICFSGAEAENSFRRLVSMSLDLKNFRLVRLPSTSPANTQAFEQKKTVWATALNNQTFYYTK